VNPPNQPHAPAAAAAPAGRRRLSRAARSVYATGDFTVNTALASLSLIYMYFLVEVAGLRPALAGLIPLIGRTVDAFTDPLMGRISDHTRWVAGRRRPYFLIGALPFGVSFSLLWATPPVASEAARFAYFTAVYCALSISITILSVPYLALQPEMAEDYDDRTSLNTYRNAASVVGVAAAIAIKPLAEHLGGGVEGYAWAGVLMGVLVSVPWLSVYRVSFERPDFQARPSELGWREGLEVVLRHRTFRRLMGFYLCGRVSMDVMGAMLLFYMTYWIGRPDEFEPLMGVFLLATVLSLPIWLLVAMRHEKSSSFIVGTVWWSASLLLLLFARPGWPPWTLWLFAPLAGIGFAAVDLMPWAMVGDVIDEDDLACGERREGLYNGLFTFLRKLSGALAVFVVMSVLDLVGFERDREQGESVVLAIRVLASVVPFSFLVLSAWLARGYPLTRRRHGRIIAELRERDAV
jgi:sugar (glycoside-pentoside-hexuronide) transporter